MIEFIYNLMFSLQKTKVYEETKIKSSELASTDIEFYEDR